MLLSLPVFLVPHVCPTGRILGPVFPVVVPRCLAHLVLQTRSAMMSLPFLVSMSLPSFDLQPMLQLPHLPTADDEVPFLCITHHPALVSCDSDDKDLILRLRLSHLLPLPLFDTLSGG
jgi:hypothetical protein